MTKRNHSYDGTDPAGVNRRQFIAVLGGAGAAMLSQPLVTSLASSVTGTTYGEEGGSWRTDVQLHYATVAVMQSDLQLAEGMFAATAGYFNPGDGGAAQYAVMAAGTGQADGGSLIDLANGLQAQLLPGRSIGYRQFGAVGDGDNDDGVQIKRAHVYAREHRLPIVEEAGEYWIKATNQIVIATDVRWGKTKFHIDESYNSKTAAKFHVVSGKLPTTLSFTPAEKAELLGKLKPGVTQIDMLAPYKNHLIFVEDTNDRIGVRFGTSGHTGWAREDFFYVEEHGRIIGDIADAFSDFTKVAAYPCDESYLVVEGGTFYLSGVVPAASGYWHNGFLIQRSRTVIRNQWVGLEPGQTDTAMNPRNGFYTFERVFDVLLEHVRLLPWEKDRPGTGQDVPQGTYGLGGRRVLNATFRNATAEGSMIHWGVFGTNLFKNFRIESCRLNRVDVHFHCWNLYVHDSEIGYKGLTLTGGGDLFIENTKRYGNYFISFRRDYGARWDGHIRLRNCRLVVERGANTVHALEYNPADFDYQYPIGYGRSIQIENFIFDYTGLASADGICQLFSIAAFSKTSTGASPRLFFPQMIECRNVFVSGRDKGVRMLHIQDPFHFDLRQLGGMDDTRIIPNCTMRFENIQGEDVPPQAAQSRTHVNFLLAGLSTAPYADEYALYPRIDFVRVGSFFGHFQGAVADVVLSRSTVRSIDAYEGGPMRGKILLDQCDIRANATGDGTLFYLNTRLGTSFVNCTVHPPIVDGVKRPDLVSRYVFVEPNKAVRYAHLNTRFSADLMEALATAGTPLEPEYIEMLRAHHPDESDLMARRAGTTAQRPAAALLVGKQGFSYYDTDLHELVVWDGTAWRELVQAAETLRVFVPRLAGAEGTMMRRAADYPDQHYLIPYAGKWRGYAAYTGDLGAGTDWSFELWKNGQKIGNAWAGGGALNPRLVTLEEPVELAAGDLISVKVVGIGTPPGPNVHATVDLRVEYERRLR